MSKALQSKEALFKLSIFFGGQGYPPYDTTFTTNPRPVELVVFGVIDLVVLFFMRASLNMMI
ncbi:hypothetical protein OFO07_03415 [Campylobacter sp. JMF_06 NA1]|uniref:hypothetical protein n=1 Tax=Campylobacter sp. JMF_06 NA1 TaxID=2983823 RepID=UPI0022E9D1D9|nr:hypothetical protein [Campylobacter sp. JMF_06 NA1]MDA3077973.1 hypothetical protein [Campylobacter sp. JMF_06 NA1]